MLLLKSKSKVPLQCKQFGGMNKFSIYSEFGHIEWMSNFDAYVGMNDDTAVTVTIVWSWNIMSFIVTVFIIRGILLVEGTEKHRRVLVGLKVNKLGNHGPKHIPSMLRSMSTLPMTLSLVASFMSAITLLGVPAEIYTSGTQFVMYGDFKRYYLTRSCRWSIYRPPYF